MVQLIDFLFSFEGRINRKKFNIFLISYIAFCTITNYIMASISFHWMVVLIISFFPWVSYLSFLARRAHDLGRSGFVILVPFYNIYIAILLLFVKGKEGPNQYGEDPLQDVSVKVAVE